MQDIELVEDVNLKQIRKVTKIQMRQRGEYEMKVIIDRFEGAFAVVEMEDKTMVDIPKVLVPDAKEGDVIDISIDISGTDARKKRIDKLMGDLWE